MEMQIIGSGFGSADSMGGDGTLGSAYSMGGDGTLGRPPVEMMGLDELGQPSMGISGLGRVSGRQRLPRLPAERQRRLGHRLGPARWHVPDHHTGRRARAGLR